MADETNWLECIAWSGEAKELPLGEETLIPNFRAVDMVRRWEVADVENEETGIKVVKTSELKPTDVVLGAQINEALFNRAVKTYGRRFFVAVRADSKPGESKLDRWQWKERYGTDVLELEALKQVRMKKPVKHIP